MTAPTPATQTTLADWLLERLDEDEAAASNPSRRHFVSTAGGFEEHDCVDLEETYLVADPARVLADVAAKRAVLDYFEHGDDIVLYRVIQLLAAPFADHPDYDERWAVS